MMQQPHYGGKDNPHEPIKIIQHYNLSFELGNVIKYVLRNKDNRIADLKKAVDYLYTEIEKLERNEHTNNTTANNK
jgi:hypothetical protein